MDTARIREISEDVSDKLNYTHGESCENGDKYACVRWSCKKCRDNLIEAAIRQAVEETIDAAVEVMTTPGKHTACKSMPQLHRVLVDAVRALKREGGGE